MNSDAGRRWSAAAVYTPFALFAAFLILAPFFSSQEMLRKWWWAGLHFWRFPVLQQAWQTLTPFVPFLVFFLPQRHFEAAGNFLARTASRFPRHPAPYFIGGLLFLWIFRSTSLIFGDSVFYVTDLIPGQAFSERGFLIMFDSVGATLIYSLGYHYANRIFHLEVLTWYNIFGLCTLLVFFLWVYGNRRRERTLATPLAMVLLFAGNWSQATFGPAEHYGQLLLCSLAFAILAVECLYRREPTWKPCLAYTLGAFFHLGIGWLFPALVYLVAARWKDDSTEERRVSILSLIIPALLTGGLIYSMGIDLSFAADSNAARGKLIPFLSPDHPYTGMLYQYSTFDIRHLAHIFQEILLMGWPGIILMALGSPYINWGAVYTSRAGRFLLFFFGGTLLFNLLWNPDLEFWRDQDLFSIVGLAVCLLGAFAVLGEPGKDIDDQVKARLVAAAICGGLAWRIPVVLYHSVLALNYSDPTNFGAYWPFAV